MMNSYGIPNRIRAAVLGAIMALACCASADAALIAEHDAREVGLTRVWFNQLAVDSSKNHAASVVVHEDSVIAVSTAGLVQSLDAETGAEKWSVRLGSPDLPMYGPSINQGTIAICNGSTLYLIELQSGRILSSRQLRGAPGGAPIVADNRVFAPLVDGMIQGLPIDPEDPIDWNYRSYGQIYSGPRAVLDRVLWTTTAGYLYSAYTKGAGVSFRYDAAEPIVGGPAVLDDFVYVAGASGKLYSIGAERGEHRWNTSVGDIVKNAPVAVGGIVYLGSERPSLHAFNAKTGEELWHAEGVNEFVAASKDRVYAVGPFGRFWVLDSKTGQVIGKKKGTQGLRAIPNLSNDRLYVLASSGLIQCLHEQGMDQPYTHSQSLTTENPAPPEKPSEEAPGQLTEPIEEEVDPFAESSDVPDEPESDPFEDDPFAEDPFGDSGDEPMESPDSSDDPFGDDDPFDF